MNLNAAEHLKGMAFHEAGHAVVAFLQRFRSPSSPAIGDIAGLLIVSRGCQNG